MAAKRPRMERLYVNLQVEVRGATRLFAAAARDLSPGGLKLRGPIRLAEGERVGITFLLPAVMKFSIPAEVRWSKDDADLGFATGVEFIPTPDSPKQVRQLIWDIQTGVLAGALRNGGTTRKLRKA